MKSPLVNTMSMELVHLVKEKVVKHQSVSTNVVKDTNILMSKTNISELNLTLLTKVL